MEKHRRYISALILAYINLKEQSEENKIPETIPVKPPDESEKTGATVIMFMTYPVREKLLVA